MSAAERERGSGAKNQNIVSAARLRCGKHDIPFVYARSTRNGRRARRVYRCTICVDEAHATVLRLLQDPHDDTAAGMYAPRSQCDKHDVALRPYPSDNSGYHCPLCIEDLRAKMPPAHLGRRCRQRVSPAVVMAERWP